MKAPAAGDAVDELRAQNAVQRAADRFNRMLSLATSRVDAASAVAFRIGFGLLMAGWATDYLISGWVHTLYEAPRFHFSYYLFDFVRPWPGYGMTWHFAALVGLALCIAAGLVYRAATILFAAGFTYFFLLDRTNYQNHYYLLALLSWTLAVLPLNRGLSFDARWGWASSSATIPAWSLWLLRFHIGLPYFFGGIAKLHPDWFAGEPMRTHLTTKSWLPLIGPFLTSEATIGLISWGGVLFDLSIVPLLLWRRTRAVAYLLCLGFHITNSFLFDIHVFPWFMIVATTVFFAPDWPRRLLHLRPAAVPPQAECRWISAPAGTRWWCGLLALYCCAQLVIPFRPFLYPGDSTWTERGHHFSWRMMLRAKSSALRFYLTDRDSGRTGIVDLRRFISVSQLTRFSRDPEMILHLAHFIRDEFRRETGRDAAVHALVLTTLNGRKPELLIDPNVDLAREPRGFYIRPWIMPQREPLRTVAWSVPLLEWERHVEIPPLRFLERIESVNSPDQVQKSVGIQKPAARADSAAPHHTAPRRNPS